MLRGQQLKRKLSKFQEAIIDFDKSISINPNEAFPYYNRGITKSDLGKNEEGIIDLDKAILLNPNYSDAYNSRGHVNMLLGNYAKAIEDWGMMQKVAEFNYIPIYDYIDEAKMKLNTEKPK